MNVGPYFAYLIKATDVSKGDNITTSTFDHTPYLKRFDTGISTGFGFSIPIKTRFCISFEVRNNLGLYNISAIPVIDNGSIKTNSTNFLFGFTYKLKQKALKAQ